MIINLRWQCYVLKKAGRYVWSANSGQTNQYKFGWTEHLNEARLVSAAEANEIVTGHNGTRKYDDRMEAIKVKVIIEEVKD